MKVNLKSLLGLAALSMTLLANTVPTWAGNVYLAEVFVQNGTAGGTMVGAHYSSDTRQYIGCTLYAAPNASPMIYCYARDRADRFLSCSSTDPAYVEQTQRMTDSSFIYFEAPSAGACRTIHIVNSSSMLP